MSAHFLCAAVRFMQQRLPFVSVPCANSIMKHTLHLTDLQPSQLITLKWSFDSELGDVFISALHACNGLAESYRLIFINILELMCENGRLVKRSIRF